MPRRLTARDALSRVFPSYDQTMYNRELADRAIAWLDECGYQIVPKDQVTLAPPEPPAGAFWCKPQGPSPGDG
jgi:hypothetical protein